MAAARTAVSCFLVSPLPLQTLRELVRRAETGLLIDVIIPDRYAGKVGLTERYRSNFTAAGGRLFSVPLERNEWRRIGLLPRNLLVVDGQSAWRADPEGWNPIAPDEVTGKLLGKLADLRTLGAVHSGKGTGVELPFPVYFSAEKTRAQPGQTVRLSWSAAGAESVEITPGKGRLPPVGDRLVRVDAPTEFTLVARRKGQTISKVLSIGVDRKLHLSYRVLAGDPFGEKRPEPIRERADLPGFFGAVAGVPLTLLWETHNAAAVWLGGKPVAVNGEAELTPSGRTTLELRARGLDGEELQQNIVVNVFSPGAAPVALPEVSETAIVAPEVPAFDPVNEPFTTGLNARKQWPDEWPNRAENSIFTGLRNWFKKGKP